MLSNWLHPAADFEIAIYQMGWTQWGWWWEKDDFNNRMMDEAKIVNGAAIMPKQTTALIQELICQLVEGYPGV